MKRMPFWRQDAFHVWRGLAEEATRFGWTDLARWCELMEQGLRRPALQALHRFVQAAHHWSVSDSRRFCVQIMRAFYRRGFVGSHFMPHPLVEDLIKPTFVSWISKEPANAVPRRWLGVLTGDMELLLDSVQRDQEEQIAREQLVARATNLVGYSTHELPYGYIGDPYEDLALLEEVEVLILGIELSDVREYLSEKVRSLKEVVESYLDFMATGRTVLFSEWSTLNGRPSCVTRNTRAFPADAYERLCKADELKATDE